MPADDEREFTLMLDPAARIGALAPGAPDAVRDALAARFGKPLPEACALRDQQRMDSVMKAVLAGQAVQPTRAEFAAPDGATTECTLRFAPMRGAGEKLSAILVTGVVGAPAPGILSRLPASILSRLMGLAKSLNLISDLGPIVVNVAKGAQILTRADAAAVYLRDQVTGLLRVAGHVNVKEIVATRPMHEGDGVIGGVLARGREVFETERPLTLPADDPAALMQMDSYIHVPLMHEARTVGVLSVFAREAKFFSETDLKVLQGLADISSAAIQRAQVRRDLSRLEAATRMVLEEAPLGIISIDTEGRITQVNSEYMAICRISEITPSSLIGRNFFSSEMVTQNRLAQSMIDLLDGKSFDTETEGLLLTGGATADMRVQGRPLRNENGRIVGAVMIFQDVSSRGEAIRALRESEARYRALFEASRDAIVVFNESGDVIEVNSEAAAMFKREREKLVDMRLSRLAPEDDERAPFDAAFAELKTTGNLTRREIVMRRFGGETFPAEVTGVRLSPDRFQIAARDVTDRVALETQLVHSQKMESIGTLAGGIAHDFNNLLGAVMGYASLLNEEIPASPRASEAVRNILAATRNAKELTGQLLAFARGGKYQVRPVELGRLVSSLRDIVAHSVPPGLNVIAALPGKEVLVLGDRGQLSGAIMNLILNARDAVGEEGRITLSLRTRAFDHPVNDGPTPIRPGKWAVVEVADTGAGIRPEDMERLFDPYYTTKGRETGAGLGLAVVDGVIAHHDGYVTVSSDVGRGAKFRIYLPRIEAVAAATESETDETTARKRPAPGETEISALEQDLDELSREAASGKDRAKSRRAAREKDDAPAGAASPGKAAEATLRAAPVKGRPTRVLIAEDEEMLRTFCETVLTREGYDVVSAADGLRALEIFESEKGDFDLVLLDMVMPKLGGELAFQKMKAIRPDVRVLLSSGYSEDNVAQSLFTLGVAGFLEKPYDIPQLIGEVTRVLGS
ncbi:PAS domain S-box protein [bacterium]|nr:PAS domain S-box protein [bacterium]